MSRSTLLLLCALAVTIALPGCMFRRLRADLERLEGVGLVGGRVSGPASDTPVVVILYRSATDEIVDSSPLMRPTSYYFSVPAGTYRIAAFADLNRDLVYQPEVEPAAYYGSPTDVVVQAGRELEGLDLRIESESRVRLTFPVAVTELGERGSPDLPDMNLGEIVRIDDPRFSVANGKLGLWQPVEFLFRVGAGIYFLEAFDPNKIPVVFVHGAAGTPANWRYLIEHLDRTKFQPWLVYYPSGVRLDAVARAIIRWINALGVRYRIRDSALVAHSMGGLVARAAINRALAEGGARRLRVFVTISTPWLGHHAAALGIEQAPTAIPSWLDMAPDSEFLAALFEPALPPTCPHYLLFSYNGKSLFLPAPNDGVVGLSSQLAMPVQRTAAHVYGFDADHMGILASPQVSSLLNEILADAAP